MSRLDNVINSYKLLKDNQELAKYILITNPSIFPARHTLISKTLNEADTLFNESNEELNDLTILSLFSIFEQIIIDYLLSTNKKTIKNSRKPFNKEVLKYSFKDADRWKFKEILDLFKHVVGANVISEIKQIHNYRNWVAHGKAKVKPLNLDPIMVHIRLKRFLSQSGL